MTQSLTVANEMLSLLGSIQCDPFSPLHVPSNGAQNSDEEQEAVDDILKNAPDEQYDSENDVGSEQDGFQGLHEKQGEAMFRKKADEAEKAVAEKEEKKKKKKKRKAEEVDTEDSQKTEKKKKKLGKSKS